MLRGRSRIWPPGDFEVEPHKKPNPDAGKAKYEPTARRQDCARQRPLRRRRRNKVTEGKKRRRLCRITRTSRLADARLMAALGTVSVDFMDGLLSQLAKAASHGDEIDEDALKFMMSVIKWPQAEGSA